MTPDLQAVILKAGKTPKTITNKAIWYWPYWTEVRKFPLAVEPINLQDQNVVTKDLRNLSFDVTGSFHVFDAVNAALNTTDLVGQVCLEINRSAVRFFVGKTLQECIDDIHGDGIDTFKDMVNEALEFFGCKVYSLDFGQYAISVSLKNWGPPPLVASK